MDAPETISLPPHWRRTSDPEHGVLVAARQRLVPASGVPPSLVLHRAAVPDDLGSWRGRTLVELEELLDGFDLEDSDAFDLAGHDVVYARFAHRDALVEVLSDQWAWLVDGVGTTLTCTVAREEYVDYCDVFEAVAETVDPVSRVA